MWKDSAEDIITIKVILIFLLNLYLIDSGLLKGLTNIVLFNVGVALVWFALYLMRVRKIYERNLSFLPTISNSIPQGHQLRIENEIEKRRAMQAAIRCQEWESFNW